MQCPRCHAENRTGRRFCGECGGVLSSTCPSCGFLNEGGERFCGGCGVPVSPRAGIPPPTPSPRDYTPDHLAERILTSKAALEGERKQVTVLFADLKGSMELLADRDPEDARKILDPVLESMMEAVHQYEGTVNQVMGDGIMALFGAPIAHEDHAVRACYAALRMQESIRRYSDGVRHMAGVPIRVRIGLNSGEVLVRSIGSDLHMDYTAVGQTTHVAGRMEQLAAPETIVLTAATRSLAEGFVEVKSLGPTLVKGLSEPLEVFQLVQATAVRSRFQAATTRGLTKFVGRTEEIAQLHEALELVRDGRGQVVALVGEPGVGKSRLLWEFAQSRQTAGCLVIEAASISHGKAMAYLPVIELLRTYFAIEPRDDSRRVREKVVAKLVSLGEPPEPLLPPLLALLDVSVDDERWTVLDASQRRQRIMDSVRHILLRESERQPVIVICEDLHWMDDETAALVDALVESVPRVPLLLLVNYRPEYQHDWSAKSYYRQLRIDPLPPSSADELLDELLGQNVEVVALKRLLIERTEGNPFFIEESVRSLVETGALVGGKGGYRLITPVHGLSVPATVQAILTARIDRLDPADKQRLHAAAVVGKDVPLGLLAAISGDNEDELRAGIARLEAAEFLCTARLFPELEYTFKHALTHEVAYASVLHGRRRELHAEIVTAIERLDPERAVMQVDRLAHHAFSAETWEKALAYCREAANRALTSSSHAEALHRIEQALQALERIGEVRDRNALELELVMQHAAALRALRGYAAPEVEQLYRKAGVLSLVAGDTPERFGFDWQQMQFFLVRADMNAAAALAGRLIAYAESRRDSALLMDAHLAMGMVLFHEGAFVMARDHFERSIAFYRPESDQPHLGTHGQDPGVFCLSYLAYCLWFLGHVDQAVNRVERALAIARRKAHAFSYVSALTFATRVHQCRRDLLKVIDIARELMLASSQHGFTYYEAQGLLHMGWARVMIGGDETAGAQMFEGYTMLEKTGTILGLRGARVQLAEAYKRLGRMDRAAWALDEAEHDVPDKATRCWDAEIARLRAELLAEGDPSKTTEACRWYESAIDTARRQGARSLELRATLSYATMLHSSGDRDVARAMLQGIARSFTEGYDTVEMREARALLGPNHASSGPEPPPASGSAA